VPQSVKRTKRMFDIKVGDWFTRMSLRRTSRYELYEYTRRAYIVEKCPTQSAQQRNPLSISDKNLHSFKLATIFQLETFKYCEFLTNSKVLNTMKEILVAGCTLCKLSSQDRDRWNNFDEWLYKSFIVMEWIVEKTRQRRHCLSFFVACLEGQKRSSFHYWRTYVRLRRLYYPDS
jgi:hypothetical protein